MKRYLFLDRDGTLISEPADEQVDALNKIALEPNVIPSLLRLKAAGFSFVMVTNQDGLGTASFPQSAFDATQAMLLQIFNSQGIAFDAIHVCPHFPKDDCDCRKPKLGLVKDYFNDKDWSREESCVVGDRETDVQLAVNMGLKGIRYSRETRGWIEITEELIGDLRHAKVHRATRETDIEIEVWLNRQGGNEISTGIGFFDHMLDQIATHGGFRMKLKAKGDLEIDDHHTIEDVGLALGQCLREALGDKRGIGRFGFVLPMDEAEAKCVLDLSGRPFLTFHAVFAREKVGDMSTDMVKHFFYSLAQTLGATLHLEAAGENTHHVVESLFKAFGRSLRQAIAVVGNELPSSKGAL